MKRGFTLLELLIVITILAILAGAMVPLFSTSRTTARDAKARADLDAIKSAAVMYHYDTGSWPTGGSSLISTSISGWNGPYLADWASDPYGSPGSPYAIRVNGILTQAQCLGSNQTNDNCAAGDTCVQITADNTK